MLTAFRVLKSRERMIECAAHDQDFLVLFQVPHHHLSPRAKPPPLVYKFWNVIFQLPLFLSSLIWRSRKHGMIWWNVRSIPAKCSRASETGMVYREGPSRFEYSRVCTHTYRVKKNHFLKKKKSVGGGVELIHNTSYVDNARGWIDSF